MMLNVCIVMYTHILELYRVHIYKNYVQLGNEFEIIALYGTRFREMLLYIYAVRDARNYGCNVEKRACLHTNRKIAFQTCDAVIQKRRRIISEPNILFKTNRDLLYM